MFVPSFIYVGGYPNGANPNSWWWDVYPTIGLLSAGAGFAVFALSTASGVWLIAPWRVRITLAIIIVALLGSCIV